MRAFGVMIAGPIALGACAAASVAAVARAVLYLRWRPPPLALLGTATTALYAFLARPWHLRWGAAPEDEERELPGDEFLPEEGTQILHAVTIEAPVEEVWPWLAQLGQDRGGFYSYEWIEASTPGDRALALPSTRLRSADVWAAAVAFADEKARVTCDSARRSVLVPSMSQ